MQVVLRLKQAANRQDTVTCVEHASRMRCRRMKPQVEAEKDYKLVKDTVGLIVQADQHPKTWMWTLTETVVPSARRKAIWMKKLNVLKSQANAATEMQERRTILEGSERAEDQGWQRLTCDEFYGHRE